MPAVTERRSLADQLAEYEAKHAFVRTITLPVEDRLKLMPGVKWSSGYRWFRSTNVICLEKCRTLRGAT
jgi:hypothetical protein